MRVRVGCLFEHDAASETAAVLMLDPHRSISEAVLEHEFTSQPVLAATAFDDLYGNRCRRLILPVGSSTFSYDGTVEISPQNEPVPGQGDVQHRIEHLPAELLHWLLPSRYIESDVLSAKAWELFGGTNPGVDRVQAVCDWIHQNIAYGVKSVQTTTTLEIYDRRGGMCRDFAHLGVTFCRALGIPARYVFGYMPDIGIPGPYPPMDFHAWFEVYLGDRWWTYDARFNTPRIGRVAIGHGRDAADVAMITTFGTASLRRMAVWADEIVEGTAVGEPLAAGLPHGG
ncbi:MAG: transglutaminase family protein [Gaiellales bacterium]